MGLSVSWMFWVDVAVGVAPTERIRFLRLWFWDAYSAARCTVSISVVRPRRASVMVEPA